MSESSLSSNEETSGGTMKEETSIPSLQELVMTEVLKMAGSSTDGLLEACAIVAPSRWVIHEEDSTIREQRAVLLEKVESKWAMISSQYDSEELQDLFTNEELERLNGTVSETVEARRKAAIWRSGEPVQRRASVEQLSEEDLKNAAVGIHRYETLKEGLQWPEGVDPTKRETYLSEEEFITVFKGISKADFAKLSQYRKNQKKKDVLLF